MPPPFSQGPKSAETVALARGMGAWAVRGNHDDSALSFLSKLDRNVQQGESGMMMSAKGGGLMSDAAVEVVMFVRIRKIEGGGMLGQKRFQLQNPKFLKSTVASCS